MPNLKFSQFDTETTTTSVTGIVGYNTTANKNIQITPANFINTTGGPYLPLAGGTMTGNIVFNSGIRAQFGGGNSEIFFTGSNFVASTFAGDFIISNYADDKDIIFQADNGSGGVTPYITIDGTNVRTKFSKNTIHSDNIKANFGNGSDLQIYHDGSNSYIKETGTGNLTLDTDGAQINLGGGGENFAVFRKDASVDLYYNGSKKFETTSAGVDITGDILLEDVSEGFSYIGMNTSDGSDDQELFLSGGGLASGARGGIISLKGNEKSSGSEGGSITLQAGRVSTGDIIFKTGVTVAEKMRILEGGNVGIGTDSPTNNLQVTSSGNSQVLVEKTGGAAVLIQAQTSAGVVGVQTNDRLDLKTNGSTRMSISNTGNVGIGTTTSANNLQVKTSSDGGGITIQRNSSTSNAFADLMFSISTSDSASPETKIRATRGASYDDTDISFITSNTEKMRIDSSGNVGIGTTSPAYKLAVYGSSTDSEIVASFGSANDANEYTAIGLSGFIAGNDATKAGLALERTSTFGVGKLHFLNNTTIDDSNMTLSDSRMVIDADGNVCIGTTSANVRRLNVLGAVGANIVARFKSPDNKGAISVEDDTTIAYVSAENDRLGLGPSSGLSTNNITIHTATNNVGIGNVTPASKLTVDGGDIEIDDSASGLILRSPDGTRYRVTVANGGAISASAV